MTSWRKVAAPGRIELRRWRDEDWPLAFSWLQASWRFVSDDFSPTDVNQFVHQKRQQHPAQSIDGEYRLVLGVYRDDELGGILEAEHISPVVAQVHVTFKKSFFGHKTTLPGMRLGMEYLWARGYSKIRAVVYPENRAIIRVIKTLGGRMEGMLNSETKRDGQLVAMHQYAIFKEG